MSIKRFQTCDTNNTQLLKGQNSCDIRLVSAILANYRLPQYTSPDGDQIYMSYDGDGKLGPPMKGTFTLVGGTGKCNGITVTGEFSRTSLKGPAEGISASFSKSTVNWKIP